MAVSFYYVFWPNKGYVFWIGMRLSALPYLYDMQQKVLPISKFFVEVQVSVKLDSVVLVLLAASLKIF